MLGDRDAQTGRVQGDTARAVISILAVVLTVGYAWPQVVRCVRHGVDGVSAGAITQSIVSACAWLGYGVARHLLPVVVADIGVASGQLVVLVLLVRHRAIGRGRATMVVVAATGLLVASQVPVLTMPIVVVAATMAITSALTQLVEVIREPDGLEGLSAATYAILLGLSCSWLAFGLMTGDVVMSVANLFMVPISAYIMWTAIRSHRLHPGGEPTADLREALVR